MFFTFLNRISLLNIFYVLKIQNKISFLHLKNKKIQKTKKAITSTFLIFLILHLKNEKIQKIKGVITFIF